MAITAKRSRTACALIIALTMSLGACAQNVCEEAAELCGAGAPGVDGSDCKGAAERLAQCVVDKGSCTTTALAECTGVPPIPGSDGGIPFGEGGVGVPGSITLTVDRYQREPRDTYDPSSADEWLIVDVTIRNDADGLPVSTNFALFSLETNVATVLRPEANSSLVSDFCDGKVELAKGGKHSCDLAFAVTKHVRPSLLHYRDPAGRTAKASFPPAACAAGEENTPALCSDGCDNDDNSFIDCADFGCCLVRTDCPAESTCAGKRAKFCATEGGEANPSACSDGCDNDRDLHYDCGDKSCCLVRTDCPSDTFCGKNY